MGDIALCSKGNVDSKYNEDMLYKEFGINAELLIDHAWGYESCTMADIKKYKPNNNSMSIGQVLHKPYLYEAGLIIVKEMAEELHHFGPGKVVITGLQNGDRFYNFVSTPDGAELISSKAGGPSRPGTGDIFASILSADALKNVPFTESVKKAAEFVRICTEGSAALNIPIKEGVCFENYLSLLTQL